MVKPIRMSDLKLMSQEVLDQIDEVKLYFELKKRKLVRSPRTLKCLKAVAALCILKIPITTSTFVWFHKVSRESALQTLHVMGDQKLLINKRKPGISTGKGEPYQWCVSPFFREVIDFAFSGKKMEG